MLIRKLFAPVEGGGTGAAAVEELAPLRIEVTSDPDSAINEINRWSKEATVLINRGQFNTPEQKKEMFDRLDRLQGQIDAHKKIIETKSGAFSASDSDEVIIREANLRLKLGDDLPKGLSRNWFNMSALRPDEIVGLATLGSRAQEDRLVAQIAGNPTLARSRALIARYQDLGDRLLIKDWILSVADPNYKRLGGTYERMKTLREWDEYVSVRTQLARGLNETTDTAGGALVPQIMSSSIGDMIEFKTLGWNVFPSITMTSLTYKWPFKRSHTKAYWIDEATADGTDTPPKAVTPSQMTFGTPIWTAQMIAVLTFVSQVLEEDSIESVVNIVREDFASAFGIMRDDVLFNGEFNAATMDGTTFNPAKTAADSKRFASGLRYYALMTASYPALVSGAAAQMTVAQAVSLIGKMGPYAADGNDLVWFVNTSGWSNLMLVNDGSARYFHTLEGSGGGLFRGQVGTFLGIPVVRTDKIPLTHTDGKVNATPGNNLRGTAILANRRQFYTGDRRAITIDESIHVAFAQFQTAVRASERVDFQPLAADGASTVGRTLNAGATPVGLLYNLL